MTRFARAKGSKASNEHVEEEATSWGEMKEQLEQKKQRVLLQEKKREADDKRKENYSNFLKEVEEEEQGKSQWADFPDAHGNILQMKNRNLKRVANPEENSNATKRMKKAEAVNTTNGKDQTAPKVKLVKKTKDTNGITKKEVKSKRNKVKNKGKNALPSVKKSVEELTEEEQKKVAKKKEKQQKQAEKRKLKKQQLKDQKLALNDSENKTNGNNSDKAKTKSLHLNKFAKPLPIPTPKTKKFNPSKEHKRRKPVEEVQQISINGKSVELVYFDGFPIKREDADRLKELRKQMISKGLPRSEVKTAMKLERRRAEKALARDKKNVCYNCRQSGHVLSECPGILANGDNVDTAAIGICFKCGSTEHTSFVCKVVKNQEFRFASCFICKEQGHISWQCPDNARGLYPKGGGCKLCGNVTHLKKDCPQYIAEQEAKSLSLPTMGSDNPDEFEFGAKKAVATGPRVNKIIKF